MYEENKTSPWLVAMRVVFTIALILCIGFIFKNSLQDGALSSMRSQALMAKVNAVLAKLHIDPMSEHRIRKLAHFLEYTMEGFWLMLCLRVYTNRFVRHVSWPLLGGMTTALCDETLQKFVAGRSSELKDVWIDMSGVVSGLFVALVILVLVRNMMTIHTIKRENKRLYRQNEEYRRQERERQHEELAQRAVRRVHDENQQTMQNREGEA